MPLTPQMSVLTHVKLTATQQNSETLEQIELSKQALEKKKETNEILKETIGNTEMNANKEKEMKEESLSDVIWSAKKSIFHLENAIQTIKEGTKEEKETISMFQNTQDKKKQRHQFLKYKWKTLSFFGHKGTVTSVSLNEKFLVSGSSGLFVCLFAFCHFFFFLLCVCFTFVIFVYLLIVIFLLCVCLFMFV